MSDKQDTPAPEISTPEHLLGSVCETVKGPFRTDPAAATAYRTTDLAINRVSLFNADLARPITIDPAQLDMEALFRYIGWCDQTVAAALPIVLRCTGPLTAHIARIIPRSGSRAPYHRGSHLTNPAELAEVARAMVDEAMGSELWKKVAPEDGLINRSTILTVTTLLVQAMFAGLDVTVPPAKVTLGSQFTSRWPGYRGLTMVMRHLKMAEAFAGLKPGNAFDKVREFVTVDLTMAAEEYCQRVASAISEYLLGRRQMLNTALSLVLARASLRAKLDVDAPTADQTALAAFMNSATLDMLCSNLTVLSAAMEGFRSGELAAKLPETWASASIDVLSAVINDSRYFKVYSLPECKKFASIDVVNSEAGARIGLIIDSTAVRAPVLPVVDFEQLPASVAPSADAGYLRPCDTMWAKGLQDIVGSFNNVSSLDARPFYARLIERVNPLVTREMGFVKLIGEDVMLKSGAKPSKGQRVVQVGPDASVAPALLDIMAAAYATTTKLVPTEVGFTFVYGVKCDKLTEQWVDTNGSMLITSDPVLALYLAADTATKEQDYWFNAFDLKDYMTGMLDLSSLVKEGIAYPITAVDAKLPDLKLKLGPHEVTSSFGTLGSFVSGPLLATNTWLRDPVAEASIEARLKEINRVIMLLKRAAADQTLGDFASSIDIRLALTPVYSWLLESAASTAIASRLRGSIDTAIQKTAYGQDRAEILRAARSAYLSAYVSTRVSLNILVALGFLKQKDAKALDDAFTAYNMDERVGALSDKRLNLAKLPIAYL